jgi:hypothetical protein
MSLTGAADISETCRPITPMGPHNHTWDGSRNEDYNIAVAVKMFMEKNDHITN